MTVQEHPNDEHVETECLQNAQLKWEPCVTLPSYKAQREPESGRAAVKPGLLHMKDSCAPHSSCTCLHWTCGRQASQHSNVEGRTLTDTPLLAEALCVADGSWGGTATIKGMASSWSAMLQLVAPQS